MWLAHNTVLVGIYTDFQFLNSFVRGDQYAVALALLDEGEVVLGVLACPNLPLKGVSVQNSSGVPIGCLFSARKGAGTMLQSLDDSFEPLQVSLDFPRYFFHTSC